MNITLPSLQGVKKDLKTGFWGTKEFPCFITNGAYDITVVAPSMILLTNYIFIKYTFKERVYYSIWFFTMSNLISCGILHVRIAPLTLRPEAESRLL